MPAKELRRNHRMGATAMKITFIGALVICGAFLLALVLIRTLSNSNLPGPELNQDH